MLGCSTEGYYIDWRVSSLCCESNCIVTRGQLISIDGSHGYIKTKTEKQCSPPCTKNQYMDKNAIRSSIDENIKTILSWAPNYSRLNVNLDSNLLERLILSFNDVLIYVKQNESVGKCTKC